MLDAALTDVLREIHRLVVAGHGDAPTDRELLERFLSGREETAFAALLQRHGAMVLGVCRRELRHAEDVEDAFQATFLVLARRASSVRKREAVGSWLHGVALRIARNLRRGALRRSRHEAPAAAPQPDVVAELTWREVRVALDEELERLPQRYRAPLVLCCLEGKSRDEAARQLGWTLGTLKGRLERGRELLRARLTRRGVTVSAAFVAATLAPEVLASVPARLVVPTVTAAKRIAAGEAVAAGLVSARVLGLEEGMATTVWLTRVKVAFVLMLTLGLAGTGAGWIALGVKEDDTGAAASSAALREAEKAPRAEKPIVERPADLRPAPPRNEVKVRPVASWGLHATLIRHGSRLHAVAFSPDGKTVAAGSDDGRIRGWDPVSGDESFSFQGPPRAGIRALVFAPDGKTLAEGRTDGGVTVWDVGRRIAQRDVVRGFARGVQTLMFAPGDRGLLWARDGGAVEGEAISGKPRPLLSGLPAPAGRCDPVRCTAFSPDGRLAVWGMEDGSVRLWDTTSRTERARFRVHAHQVWCVAFSPDGRVVASVDHFGTARTWDAATGRELATTQHGGGGHVQALAFSPDGTLLATGTAYHVVRLWEVATGKERILQGHGGSVGCVAFSPDGQFLASAGSDGTVKLWAPAPAAGADAAGPPGE